MAKYELVIIGTGAAGYSAAIAAAHCGAVGIAIVDRAEPQWGTCLNVGCIPSKYLLTLAEYYFYRNHGHAALDTKEKFNIYLALAEKDGLIQRQRDRKRETMEQLGVEILSGNAEFVSAKELRVGDRIIEADRFIIATGSSPVVPPVEGIGSVPYWTNVEALEPDKVPASLIVVGGRSLGLEFAQLYRHLGSDVTVLQRSDRIIPEEEPEIAELMAGYLREEGIAIRTGCAIKGVKKIGERETEEVEVRAEIAGKEETLSAEKILFATGRSPDTRDLHLEVAGVKTRPGGAIVVDETLLSTTPNIWAAGDVTGDPMLETSARYGGEIAGVNAIAGQKRKLEPALLPRAVFTTPQVASVGMTAKEAERAGRDTIVRCAKMDQLSKTAMIGDTRGMVKIVADRATREILGIHIIAPQAAEIIPIASLALKKRVTIEELADTYYAFPTLAEIVSICAHHTRSGTKGSGDVRRMRGRGSSNNIFPRDFF